MKFFYALFMAAMIAIPNLTASAITIDGVAETAYSSAVSTQALGTSAADNTSTNQNLANGSELDASYGFVSNGVLYLVMAGNFDSGPGGFSPNDQLQLFVMSDAGGTDHTLGKNYNGTYAGRINNMPGLTFDTGFTPNYWFGVNVGTHSVGPPLPYSMFVDYMVVCSNCPSAYLGEVNVTNPPPAAILTNVYFGSVIQAALDNSNTNGVDATPCTTNVQGAAQSVAAAAVRSGVELSIPVAVIGSPLSTVKICAFMTDQTMTYIYNQALGPFDGGAGYCTNMFTIIEGEPFQTKTAGFDFNSMPGQHSFTITVPPCDVLIVNPSTSSFISTGGVGSVTVTNSGCPVTVTTTDTWLTVTSPSVIPSGQGTFTYSVGTNTAIQARTGTFFVTDTVGSGYIVTQKVTISETGVGAPPLGVIVTDGTAENTYGCPLVVQQIGTGFGSNSSNDLLNANGSELDAAYGFVENNVLFLVLAGNLEAGGNSIDIFLSTGAPGQNALTNVNPDVNFGKLNIMGASGTATGLTFDTGFVANYYIGADIGGGSFFVNYAQLWPGGTNALGVATNGYYLGYSAPTNGTLQAGTNPFGIQATINNSNTNGVSGGPGGGVGCATNSAGVAESVAARLVRTGFELAIPLPALGSPTGSIAVCAFVNNGDHTYMANQFLGPLGDGSTSYCQANLGTVGATSTINLGTFPGQHYFLVGPEMRITSISTVAANVVIKFQTEANTNLLYRLQRNSAVTNAGWLNASGLLTGNGGILSVTNVNGATNPQQFYRIDQIPQCQ